MELDSIQREKLRLRKSGKKWKLKQWHQKKEDLSIKWIENETIERGRKLKQGAIYLCVLGENIGSEINTDDGELRPVLVVSNDTINNTADNVTVVPLSKQLRYFLNRRGEKRPKYKSHYFLFKENYPFLHYDSAVRCEEVRTVSKIRIDRKLGNVSTPVLKQILKCLDWVTKG
jgi:mRNA interferase MazF